MMHIAEFLKVCMSEDALRKCDFAMERSPLAHSNDNVIFEDEMADLLGQAGFTMAFIRLRRLLWLVSGWPHRWAAALDSADEGRSVIAAWRRDRVIFDEFNRFDHLIASDRGVIDRHVFQLTNNMQIEAALKESSDTLTTKVADFLTRRFSGGFSTQAVEDMNGEQKNSGQVRGAKKFRKPATSWATVLKKGVLDVRHKFTPVGLGAASCHRSRTLPADVFGASQKQESLSFSEIVTTSSKPDFFSPSAVNHCLPVSDLFMLRRAKDLSAYNLCRNAWMGELFDISHHILLTQKRTDGSLMHLVGGYYFPNSCVVCWPIQIRSTSSPGAMSYFEPDLQVVEPVLLPIFSLHPDDLTATTYTWRSWLWQQQNLPSTSGLRPAVRPFLDAPFGPALEIAAKHAFWHLPKSSLLRFSAQQGVDISEGATLYEVVHTLCSAILRLPDEDVVAISHRRLQTYHAEAEHVHELLQVDSAVQCLDQADHARFAEAQQQARNHEVEQKAYSAAYRERKAVVSASRTSANRKKKKADAGLPKYPPRIPSTIPQESAKQWVPPGCSIWRALCRSSWNAHLEPYARISESWGVHGEAGALIRILRRLWRMYNEKEGRPDTACPFDGLFRSEGGSASSSKGP